jgi:methyltransferase (TIGR00027 family)
MKAHRPSRTAMRIAAARARESAKPANERVCYDPFAWHFLGPTYRLVARIPFLIRHLRKRHQERFPGIFDAIVARTRYMDDHLQSCIDGGMEQFVSLGAGFDARPYRFEGLKSGLPVFEVDHPATQRVKKRKLAAILGALPAHVTFVPVRFNRQDLGRQLLDRGYDRNLKTLYIWEGVCMYLSAEAVDKTLEFVSRNAPPGSGILFDIIPDSKVRGPAAPREGIALGENVRRLGEALRFGIEPLQMAPFLAKRGYDRVALVNARDCKAIYFKGVNSQREVSTVLTFVHATVAGDRTPSGDKAPS